MKYALALCFIIAISCQKPELHTVCFTGDVLLDRGIRAIAQDKGNGYFSEPIFTLLAPYRYRFINLECPLTLQNDPIIKPIVFRGKPDLVSILLKSKITHASMANNHANDQRARGLQDTYQTLTFAGIFPLGASSKERSSCQPAELVDQNKTIVVFSLLDLEISHDETSNLCACGASKLATKIWEYKNIHPSSKVICYIHWGLEYNPFPSASQEETAKMLIDAGADAIVGHHPHVIQKIDYYRNKVILYSLGNFVFDQRSPETRSGLVAGFDIKEGELQLIITPYEIDNGRPLMLLPEVSSKVMARLSSMSRNVVLEKKKAGWIVYEKTLREDKMKVEEEKNVFKPHEINDKYFQGTASLEKLNYSKGYRMSVVSKNNGNSDELRVPYPVYRFEIGDLNCDGITDILVGVIKSTHFDPKVTKRLFALTIDSGQIRPLWLGSRVCQNLVDFKPIGMNDKINILTIEQDAHGNLVNGLYEWKDFGLSLVKYTSEKLNYSQALYNMEHEKK